MDEVYAAITRDGEPEISGSRSSNDIFCGEEISRAFGTSEASCRQLCVEGAPATTTTRTIIKTSPRKEPKLARRRIPDTHRHNNARRRETTVCNNNNEESIEWEVEQQHLHDELRRLKYELVHARNEKHELEESFRRLDREIADGYNISARTACELRIAELVAKNQKLSEVLDKELMHLEELRSANAILSQERDDFHQRLDLVQRALTSMEMKQSDLTRAHEALISSYSAAQEKMESLQGEVNDLQEKLISTSACSAQIAEYESKLRRWEHKCRGLEQSIHESSQQVIDHQQAVEEANLEVERVYSERTRMESEVRDLHDKLIRMTAALRAVEGKFELNIQSGDGIKQSDLLSNRILQLETELKERTKAYAEVKHAFNQLMSEPPGPTQRNGARTMKARSAKSSVTQDNSKAISRVAALIGKLDRVEDARDRSNRALDVLMQSLPALLQRVDDLSAKYQGVCESNEILKGAIEQMQASWVIENGRDMTLSPVSYLYLARQHFTLEAPLNSKLFAEISSVPLLTDYISKRGAPRLKSCVASFQPFRTVAVSNKAHSIQAKSSDNQSEAHKAEGVQIMMLSADPEDSSGEAYLDRSKINVFLQFVQEFISKNRELAWRANADLATQQTTIQLLNCEMDDLKYSIRKLQQHQSRGDLISDPHGESSCDVSGIARRQLLLKLIDLYAEKQQQQRQSTFVTQAETSGYLHGCNGVLDLCETASDGDVLSLRHLKLDDADLNQVFWKLKVTEARFVEVHLDDNEIHDSGALLIGEFLSSLPDSIQVVSLGGNQCFSQLGIDELRRGMAQNNRIHRVETDPESSSLLAFAAIDSFADIGQPTIIFRVVIPTSNNAVSPRCRRAARLQEVEIFVETLQQRGVATNINRKKTPADLASKTPKAKTTSSLTGTARLTTSNRRVRVLKSRQQLRLQALEDALRNASSPQPQSRFRKAGSNTTSSAHRQFTTPYAQALSKRLGSETAGRAHMSTVRRLRR